MPFSNEPQRLFVIFMTAACDPPTRLISALYEDEILQILLINQNTIVSLVPFYRNNSNESLAINNSRSESNYLTFFPSSVFDPRNRAQHLFEYLYKYSCTILSYPHQVTNLLGYLLLSYYLFLEMLSILVRLDVAGKRETGQVLLCQKVGY
jgi:hypothetical protein